ncbi:MAG TPA: AgmX/PglI C-terminal domain-containing protein [Polyangiaceae bacterium]|nr:AgmX/PglI C-terminal domain-containing protein [Polyangiaceae bacterium]
MRTVRFSIGRSLAGIGLVACAACGGSEAGSAPGAKSAEVSVEADARPPAAPPEPSTTTNALGDGGETSGVKLAESQPTASPAPSASAGRGRAHEPGRGIEDIRAIVIAHRDEARACYDKALASHPGIEGDLVVSFTIDPKGIVSQAALDTARSQIVEPQAAACIVGIIKRIRFAPSPGGYETRASYPFNFHPRHTSSGSSP